MFNIALNVPVLNQRIDNTKASRYVLIFIIRIYNRRETIVALFSKKIILTTHYFGILHSNSSYIEK